MASKNQKAQDPLIKELIQFSENDLQAQIIEPLLREKGFQNVRDTSGPEEKGKDLVATKYDEFGQLSLCAIQIKKFKPSGRVASSRSFGNLINQLRQAILEPVIDPNTLQRRSVDRLLFFTPYPLEPRIVERFFEQLRDIQKKGVSIIDGVMLAGQIREHLPTAITSLSEEAQYRASIVLKNNALEETSKALQIHRTLLLDQIYVEAEISDENRRIIELASVRVRRLKPRLGVVKKKETRALAAIAKRLNSRCWHHIYRGDARKLKAKELFTSTKRLISANNDVIELDVTKMFSTLQERAKPHVAVFRSPKDATSSAKLKQMFNALHSLGAVCSDACKIPFVSWAWEECLVGDVGTVSIPSRYLIHSGIPVCIVGPAGAGKTTLLRRLTQLTAKLPGEPIPIFVPLVRLPDTSIDAILDYCVADLVHGGYSVSKEMDTKGFEKSLERGAFRLFFDGLDEVGANAADALKSISMIHADYPSVSILVSCRSSFKIEWPSALLMSMLPFSEDKVKEFIEKWFPAEPMARKAVVEWVLSSKYMRSIATTPLIAALICSLYAADIDLPDSEEELYERRLELLLGLWDRAKGVAELPVMVRRAYLFFLMRLAYSMQREQVRARSYEDVVQFSRGFQVIPFHRYQSSLLLDCIGRGLLVQDRDGFVSFGHLTYQEHLAARWLAHSNPIDKMVDYVDDHYWLKVLQFYAMKMGDITPLAAAYKKKVNSDSNELDRLRELVKLAPFTDRSVIDLYRQV